MLSYKDSLCPPSLEKDTATAAACPTTVSPPIMFSQTLAAAADGSDSEGGGTIQHWERGSLIGKGAFSTVYKLKSQTTGKTYAAKLMPRNKTKSKNLRAEVLLQQRVNHPNIVKLYAYFTDQNYHVLVRMV